MRKLLTAAILALTMSAPASVAFGASPATLYPARDGATAAWTAKADGSGVGIAIIDTGGTSLGDFSGRFTQVQISGQTNSLTDAYGHGTLVSGIAAGSSANGQYSGIAPKAKLYAINVSRDGSVKSSDVITALKWVFDNSHKYNIRVVNLSWSESMSSTYKKSAVDLAVERLWASGVLVVVAAGERGQNDASYAPAHDPLVLTVGAYDMKDTAAVTDDQVADFTSRGTTLDGFAKPELLAPGRHIASTLPASTTLGQQAPAANRPATGYASVTGTGYAAPQVAGAAAIVFQKHPDWSPDQVKWLLVTKAGAAVSGSSIGTLTLTGVYNFSGTPGRANQAVLALVCAPGAACTTKGSIASSWNSSSWNSSSWNSSSWNSSSWNSTNWTGVSWESSSWNSSSWNSSSWNSSSWNDTFAYYTPWG